MHIFPSVSLGACWKCVVIFGLDLRLHIYNMVEIMTPLFIPLVNVCGAPGHRSRAVCCQFVRREHP